MTNIHFAQAHWLWLGALACLTIIVLLARAARLRRRAIATLAGARFVTTVSAGRRLVKQVLVVTGVAATFVALARPLAGFRWEEEQQEGIDLMFAVDTSKSMLTPDLRPDRLTRAKLAVSDLLREFPGERAGLIAFAGDAFVQAPMTVDHDVFAEALAALDTTIISRGGTNIAAPIRAAVEAMATEPGRRKVLVLLSDGEDLQGEALGAARDAAQAGLVIDTVGVGTPAGDLVPVERHGVRDVMRDADGQAVHSRLDEHSLRQLAEATGGAYAALGPSGRGLETLYREHLAQLPRRTVSERMHKVYTERFQIPLAVAIGCLLLELALGERRRRIVGGARSVRTDKKPAGTTSTSARRSVAAVSGLGLALLLSSARPAAASERHELAPKPGEASVSTYNDGTAAYRKKDYPSAQRQFQDATHTTDIAMQEDAYYDLGNARYRLGQASLAKDRPAAIEAWKSAVAAYNGALALHAKDADARFNRDLVSRRLTALEDQQRQEQKNQDPKNQQDHSGQKNKQSQNGQQDPNDQQGTGNQKNQQGKTGQQVAGQPSSADDKGQNGKDGNQEKGQGKGPDGQQDQAANAPQEQPGQHPSRPDQGPSKQRPGTQHDQGAAAPRAAQPESPPRQGPGVVSGQPGQRDYKPPPNGGRRDPGALSANEAEQLLDSVAGELRRVPVAGARRQQPDVDDKPIKDW
jgi:Ca-activated chloride channel family protein